MLILATVYAVEVLVVVTVLHFREALDAYGDVVGTLVFLPDAQMYVERTVVMFWMSFQQASM